jgi:RNA polymerase-binding protein DksA
MASTSTDNTAVGARAAARRDGDDDLSPTTPPDARQLLLARRDDLHREIDDGNRRRAGEDRFEALAGEAPDTGDIAVATEQSDLRNAQVSRDAAELRAVQAALGRIDDGTYGWCARCGQPIDAARLLANPAAERCVPCQTKLERTYAGAGAPVPRTL